jgi:maltose O-acetyltransferase
VTAAKAERSFAERLKGAFFLEFGNIRPRQHLFSVISRALPDNSGAELRAQLLRLRGITVGSRTVLLGTPEVTGGESRGFERLSIGDDCVIEAGCAFEVGETIAIGNRVTIGYQCLIITTTHEIGPREHRCGTMTRSAVRVEDGVVIGPRCVVLPGVTIGAGAVIDPGSVVNKSVPPNVRMRGIPAKKVEDLP